MKNKLILNHDVCEVIDAALISRNIMKKGNHFATDTLSYTENFLKDSCYYEEIILDDEIFYEKNFVNKRLELLSDKDLSEIIENWN
jgi:hypothetical protein